LKGRQYAIARIYERTAAGEKKNCNQPESEIIWYLYYVQYADYKVEVRGERSGFAGKMLHITEITLRSLFQNMKVADSIWDESKFLT